MLFDATVKDIVQGHIADFEAVLRLSGPQPATVLNVDLSAISAATDVVFGYGDPPSSVVDLNFQAGRDARLPRRVLLYNALLHYRYGVPVHSVVVLLCRDADEPGLTGKIRYEGKKRRGKLTFTFEVVRLWKIPVRRILRGGLGALPLAPLCRLPEGVDVQQALPGVIKQVAERLQQEATPEDAAKLITATYVLTGLRISREEADELFRGVKAMRESTTYQAILDEGRIEALHGILLRQGRLRFGPPSEAVTAAVTGIRDVDRLGRMADLLLTASGWQEVLDTP
jgi:predicted transposase YdaD